jgi:hypothetical protein
MNANARRSNITHDRQFNSQTRSPSSNQYLSISNYATARSQTYLFSPRVILQYLAGTQVVECRVYEIALELEKSLCGSLYIYQTRKT